MNREVKSLILVTGACAISYLAGVNKGKREFVNTLKAFVTGAESAKKNDKTKED